MRTVAHIATVLTATAVLLVGFAAPGAHAVRGQLFDADGALAAVNGHLSRPQMEPRRERMPKKAHAHDIDMAAIAHTPGVPEVVSLKLAGGDAQRLAGLTNADDRAKDRSIPALALALNAFPAARPNLREATRDQDRLPDASRGCETCARAIEADASFQRKEALEDGPASSPIVIRFERVVININL